MEGSIAVVRNPYARVISAVNWMASWGAWSGEKRDLNGWVLEHVGNALKNMDKADNNMVLPCWYFIHNSQGEAVIQHVLRFENLVEELSSTLKLYGMSWVSLPHIHKVDKKVAVGDLNAASIFPHQ